MNNSPTTLPTTRKFPRSMDEAFPHGASYGCAITHYRHRLGRLGGAAAFCAWVLALAWIAAVIKAL